MTRPRVVWRAFAASLALTGGLLNGPAQAADTLKVAASKGAVSLPLHVAAARGSFATEGLEVELIDCNSGRDCFAAMVQGKADVATSAEVVAALNSVQVPDLAIIATLSTSSHQIKLIGRRSKDTVTTWGFTGKRVGTVIGSSAQYFLDTWLVFHGLDPSRVQTVGLPLDDVVPAFRRGDVDAVAIWDPVAGAAQRALGADAVLLPNPRVYTQHFALMIQRGTLSTHRSALVKLLEALVKAEKFIAADPQRASEILAMRLGTDVATARSQMAEHDFRMRLDQSLVTTLASQARWAVRGRYLRGKPPDASSLIYPDLMMRVAPAAVSMPR